VHLRYRGVRWLGLALGALFVLPACTAESANEPVSVTTPFSEVTASAAPSGEPTSTQSARKPARNDLKNGRATRTLKAGGVRATVRYSLQNRVERWAPGVAQPLKVSMRARQPSTNGYVAPTDRKIYLSRVTAYLDVSDASGHLDAPDPLVDSADVNPGFLVTSPSSYTQVLSCRHCPMRRRN
jgi:hypothetical protein